jgi:hypothetical protein
LGGWGGGRVGVKEAQHEWARSGGQYTSLLAATLRPAAGLTSGIFLTSHVPPCGHATPTHYTLAANAHNK